MPAPGGDRLLLLGASVRALAQLVLASGVARRRFPGGFLAIDFFGDADLRDAGAAAPIEMIALARDAGLPRSVTHLGRVTLGREWDAFLPAGGLENRPGLLRLLERRGRPLGPASVAV